VGAASPSRLVGTGRSVPPKMGQNRACRETARAVPGGLRTLGREKSPLGPPFTPRRQQGAGMLCSTCTAPPRSSCAGASLPGGPANSAPKLSLSPPSWTKPVGSSASSVPSRRPPAPGIRGDPGHPPVPAEGHVPHQGKLRQGRWGLTTGMLGTRCPPPAEPSWRDGDRGVPQWDRSPSATR